MSKGREASHINSGCGYAMKTNGFSEKARAGHDGCPVSGRSLPMRAARDCPDPCICTMSAAASKSPTSRIRIVWVFL